MKAPTQNAASIVSLLILLPRWRRGARAEAVLRSAAHQLQVLHAPGADLAATLGLLRPLEGSDLRRGIAAGSALLVLHVVGALTAAGAQAVGLLVALTHRWCSITHGCKKVRAGDTQRAIVQLTDSFRTLGRPEPTLGL